MVRVKDKSAAVLAFGLTTIVVGYGIYLGQSDKAAPRVTKYSTSEFSKIKQSYLDVVDNQDPKVALEKLKVDLKSDVKLERSCHPLVHAIGHEAFAKYNDFGVALGYMNEVCGSGYIHGLMESYFANTDNVEAKLVQVCKGKKFPEAILSECYHAIGHGLMYYSINDVPASIKQCHLLDEVDAYDCTSGVFMENFNTDQKLHASQYLDKTDPLSVCAPYSGDDKINCYYYAPAYYLALHNQDFTRALKWCDGIGDGELARVCAGGVAYQLANGWHTKILEAKAFCEMAPPRLIEDCVFILTDVYVDSYANLEAGSQLCQQMAEPAKQYCKDTIEDIKDGHDH